VLFLIGRRSRLCLAARGCSTQGSGAACGSVRGSPSYWSDYEPIISSHSLGTGRKTATAPNGEVRGCAKYLRSVRKSSRTDTRKYCTERVHFSVAASLSPHLPLPLLVYYCLPPHHHQVSRSSPTVPRFSRCCLLAASCPVLCQFLAL
jgi:hypothetical protein